MRWLFLLVLSLNLAYIAWQMNLSSTEADAQAKAIKNVKPIYLLSEVESLKQTEVQADNPVEAFVSGEQLESAQVKLAQNEPSQAKAGQIKSGQNDSDLLSAAVDPQKSASEKLIAGAKNDINDEAADTSITDPLLLSPKLAENDLCYTLGPFRDLDVLRELTREIKTYVVTVDYRGREVNEHSLYWVYIKPEKDRISAIATGRQLKSKKIKDYYVIREGEKVNGVSLGYFRNKDGAYGLVDKVKKMGFDVVLEPVYKTYTVYWMDYQVHDNANIPQSIFDKYLEAAKADKITRLDRDCAA